MEQIFIKRIQGHELEFNRKPFPISYAVSIKDKMQGSIILNLEKDEKGVWDVSHSEKLPVWFNEISLDIHYAIEENEVKLRKTTAANAAIENNQNTFQNSLRLSCLY